MSAKWASKPLGAICEFSNGLWTGKKPPFEQAIVVRNTNFRPHGRLDHSDVALLDVEAKQLGKRRLQLGDIIIEKSGGGPKQPVGRVAYFDKKDGVYSFSNFTSSARVLNKSEVDPEYLIRYLDWCYISGVTEGMQSHSTGIRNLDFSAYKAIEVPLPVLEEQRRIVDVLDKTFAAIATATANAKKNLANARKMFEATARMAFGGKLTAGSFQIIAVEALALARKGSMRTGPFGSQLLHSEFVDDGVAVLGIDNAVDNEFRWGKRRFITEAKFQSLSRFLVHPGDVIITIMGTCGRCAVIPDDVPRAINSKHLFCISLDQSRCLPTYLHAYFLHAPDARAYLEERAQGSIMAGLNMGIIRDMPVRLPSLEAQVKIVRAIEVAKYSADTLANHYQKKLDLLAALKQSLLHRAFSGELIRAMPETIAA